MVTGIAFALCAADGPRRAAAGMLRWSSVVSRQSLVTGPRGARWTMGGLVMGGGVGVSAHGSVRVVTQRSKIAMPDVVYVHSDRLGELVAALAASAVSSQDDDFRPSRDFLTLGERQLLAWHLVPDRSTTFLPGLMHPPVEVAYRLPGLSRRAALASS